MHVHLLTKMKPPQALHTDPLNGDPKKRGKPAFPLCTPTDKSTDTGVRQTSLPILIPPLQEFVSWSGPLTSQSRHFPVCTMGDDSLPCMIVAQNKQPM